MAHKTLIGGTAYEISGGKTLVNGTAYSIAGGKTLVGGTEYDVSFSNLPAVGTKLENCSPKEVQAVARSGQAANYWAVGDNIGVALNGTVGALSLNATYYAFILGFNHNSNVEGSNSIHFQFGKTSAGVDICFCDNEYGRTSSQKDFIMTSSGTNSGGWNNSYMRNTICPEFLSAMPAAWQNVIAACTKYSDNTGDRSNTASDVTSTSDKIWLLSEFEVHGTKSFANNAEQNYQKQYDYYKNGNSKVKYNHSETTRARLWWLRSVHSTGNIFFCAVSTSGDVSYQGCNYSYGFAPGFMVA